MIRFRAKPVEVLVWQFTDSDLSHAPDWIKERLAYGEIWWPFIGGMKVYDDIPWVLHVASPYGMKTAYRNMWIVRRPCGTIGVMDTKVFKKVYETVDSPTLTDPLR